MFVCVAGCLFTFTAAGARQAILLRDDRAGCGSSPLGPVEVKAFGEHHGLQVLVLFLLPKPLLLQ